ncbi:flavin reductase family protein [Texcoconibacillus texcoconensis]|uniref:Flavin reductase (DIM6/NTAB) family NADH-FMN oxidoreductase RutF n=1 Tax=Texcoconibacillus texcoconensis TaxID=1095777 RepID=A0A840QSA5_9BACI|nr:flavin reductase family protein [Texcoconibacillus texcoconensis]MBB5174245.1 flavin reductase (DIM6/NTAB) family NADH-FMN oxidoreductase RutF [Texcoconibacillus texcoconensis]
MLTKTNQTLLHCYPGLIALITAKHEDVQNVMAAGWHSYMSFDPPIYGVAIGEGRFTHDLITQSGAYAVNFLPAEKAKEIEESGKMTGADGDKLEALQLDWQESENLGVPILTDAYVAYECEVRDQNTYGDHDWFVADIRGFYQDEKTFQENGLPNFSNITLPLYLGQSHFIFADKNATIKKVDD